jgi:hypothetical protein
MKFVRQTRTCVKPFKNAFLSSSISKTLSPEIAKYNPSPDAVGQICWPGSTDDCSNGDDAGDYADDEAEDDPAQSTHPLYNIRFRAKFQPLNLSRPSPTARVRSHPFSCSFAIYPLLTHTNHSFTRTYFYGLRLKLPLSKCRDWRLTIDRPERRLQRRIDKHM